MSLKTLGLSRAELHISAYVCSPLWPSYSFQNSYSVTSADSTLWQFFKEASLFMYMYHPGGFQLYGVKNSSWNGLFFNEKCIMLWEVWREDSSRMGYTSSSITSSKSFFSFQLNQLCPQVVNFPIYVCTSWFQEGCCCCSWYHIKKLKSPRGWRSIASCVVFFSSFKQGDIS